MGLREEEEEDHNEWKMRERSRENLKKETEENAVSL